jgi:predicted PurR-regulated permease PerM
MLPLVGLTLGQFGAGLATLRVSGKLLLAGLATVLSILPIGFLLGWITILLTSYPHFLTTH